MDIKEIIAKTGLSNRAFAKRYEIPYNTLNSWVWGDRTPPEYVLKLLDFKVEYDEEVETMNIHNTQFAIMVDEDFVREDGEVVLFYHAEAQKKMETLKQSGHRVSAIPFCGDTPRVR